MSGASCHIDNSAVFISKLKIFLTIKSKKEGELNIEIILL